MRDDLAGRLAVEIADERFEPRGTQIAHPHLGHLVLRLSRRAARVSHGQQHAAAEAALAKLRLEPPARRLVGHDDLAVPQRGRSLQAVRVRHELPRRDLVEAALHAQEVLVIDARQV